MRLPCSVSCFIGRPSGHWYLQPCEIAFSPAALCTDSIFVNFAGSDPPFLVSSGAYATISNCFFRNVHLPRSELFDVSRGGAITLINCHFSNISIGNGIADTTSDDYGHWNFYDPYSQDYDYYYQYISHSEPDKHGVQDIALAPAPAAATLAYGSDYVILNGTTSDCQYIEYRVLPGCPEQSSAERPGRIETLGTQPEGASSSSGEAPTESDWYDDYTKQKHMDQQRQRIKRTYPFYDQYYADDYARLSFDNYQAPVAVPEGGPAGAPMEDDLIVTSLGEQLSMEHPWFQAVREVCA